MNRYLTSPLLDHLSASYALGTLRHGARRRFESLAREFPAIRASALLWQGQWAGLSELQAAVPPDPAVWVRINNLVQAQKAQQVKIAATPTQEPAASVGGWLQSILLWRTMTVGAVLATVVAVGVGLQMNSSLQTTAQSRIAQLEKQLLEAPQVQYVSVLQDAQSAASMLVTFDPKNQQLTLQRVGGFQEGNNQSLQLWALPPGAAPQSLGVLGQAPLLQLPVAEGQVKAVPTLAISLEPKGGVPSATGPTGPVLFTGALIERML
jgi:anti-sigma-K factor RskA